MLVLAGLEYLHRAMGGGGESWIEMPSGNLHHQDQGYMDPGDRSQVQWHGPFHDHNFNFNFNVDLNRVPVQHHPGAGEEAMAPEHLFVLPDPDGTDDIYELDELDPLQFLPPAQHGAERALRATLYRIFKDPFEYA